MGLLHKVLFGPGINAHIIEHLKIIVELLNPMDRYCTIMFDEMALEAGLHYDKHKDCVFGLEDYGHFRQPSFADHVLTFMIRGVKRKFKQPICFYFVKGTIKTLELKKCIEEVVLGVLSTGLNIVATVSDQGATNVAAINLLMKEAQNQKRLKPNLEIYEGYFIKEHQLLHVYNPPHLLKSIRNNLLTKNVTFTWRGERQMAKWDYFVNTYEDLEIRNLPKITEAHVYHDKMKKMKVSLASQNFQSQSRINYEINV